MPWRYVGHVGTGFSHAMLKELHGKLWPLRTSSSPFRQRVKDEATTTWVKPRLVAEVKFTDGPRRRNAPSGVSGAARGQRSERSCHGKERRVADAWR